MKKVKRTYNKYFGVTRRRMRVKMGATWHTYLMIAGLSFIGFKMFRGVMRRDRAIAESLKEYEQ